MTLYSPGPGKQGGRQSKHKLLATWDAIRRIPTGNFPLLLPHVHPIAAFFILSRLKREGFSDCRVETTRKGLVVYARR